MLKEANPDWGCQRISDMLVRGPGISASPQRRVRSGSRLPLRAPRGLSSNPAGPSVSNFFSQAYNVYRDIPTNAAKSLPGIALRSHMSSSHIRCSPVTGRGRFSGFTSRCPFRRARKLDCQGLASADSPLAISILMTNPTR